MNNKEEKKFMHKNYLRNHNYFLNLKSKSNTNLKLIFIDSYTLKI